MTDIIQVENLSYAYQGETGKEILKNLAFHVKQGEWLSIVGHNGSGKSTLVRLLDGLLEATSGEILMAGSPLSLENVWEKRRLIGMVFQNPDNQFVGATVEDDIAFGLENQGLPYEIMKERVEEALAMVGMEDFRKKEPARLSGGQKQRVALAGVIAMRPKILMLDEATSMLDPEGRREVMNLVKKIRQESQMTVLSITHDLDEIALSDRILVLKEGQVAALTTPRELFSRKDLSSMGLDEPFANQVKEILESKGLSLPEGYVTERELQDYLWEFI